MGNSIVLDQYSTAEEYTNVLRGRYVTSVTVVDGDDYAPRKLFSLSITASPLLPTAMRGARLAVTTGITSKKLSYVAVLRRASWAPMLSIVKMWKI